MENDQNHAEMNLELEFITLLALDRCVAAGAPIADVTFLAQQLGVGRLFQHSSERLQ